MIDDEAVDYGEMRRKLHSAITEIIREEDSDDSLISGWTLIVEGIHPDNRRSLLYITSDATGDRALTPWGARGFMNHVEETILNAYSESDDLEEED